MKKIIGGKLYDTEKANLVLEYRKEVLHVSLYDGFFTKTYDAQLYKTNKGNWFEVREDTNLYEICNEGAKRIIQKENIDLYLELFGAVEEA